jgi:hypothetical protein
MFAGAAFTVAAGLAQEFDFGNTNTKPDISVEASAASPAGHDHGPENFQIKP